VRVLDVVMVPVVFVAVFPVLARVSRRPAFRAMVIRPPIAGLALPACPRRRVAVRLVYGPRYGRRRSPGGARHAAWFPAASASSQRLDRAAVCSRWLR
jgi:hypothetical protein